MKECDNSTRKIHTYKHQLHIVHKSSNNVWHLITKTITTLQHSATLHHTSPNYTLLHFATLHTSPHFTQLHFTTLNDISLPLIYTSLTFYLALSIYISYRSISLHIVKSWVTGYNI
jgi:hypothetical protein